jgi:2-keto-4-pentenoate hydratase/2-oxohepta-3-ene-1,7-dioic acid hydratase in catechol pathway
MTMHVPLSDGRKEPIQRIFCVGKNYAEHIKEIDAVLPDGLLVFMKSPLCLVEAGQPIALPRNQGAVHHELELVLAVGKAGHHISPEHAEDHVAAITLGIDLTLRDLQMELRRKAWPWEPCKSFEHSAPLGVFAPYRRGWLDEGIDMTLHVNDTLRQRASTKEMMQAPWAIISTLSATWQLRPGDLIFTGSPAGVGPLAPGDQVTIAAPGIGQFSWPCA